MKQLTDKSLLKSSSDCICLWCKFQVYHVSLLLCVYLSLSLPLAYLLGMIVTFAVMLLSGMGQPALLYLVPFTLITSAVVAGCRGEMRQFWAGTTYEVSVQSDLIQVWHSDSCVLPQCFQTGFCVFLKRFIPLVSVTSVFLDQFMKPKSEVHSKTYAHC